MLVEIEFTVVLCYYRYKQLFFLRLLSVMLMVYKILNFAGPKPSFMYEEEEPWKTKYCFGEGELFNVVCFIFFGMFLHFIFRFYFLSMPKAHTLLW